MHVGREGAAPKDILLMASALRICDWEDTKGKRGTVSSVVNREPRFLSVSRGKYTLRCFPGVVEWKPPKPVGTPFKPPCALIPSGVTVTRSGV